MTRILDRIDRPQDLHSLSEEELVKLAHEVREHIIDTVGEIGGHFGANLGTCELAVALHSLLDSPHDKILWDVGHQAYPHKVLTGRRDQLPTIRQYEGLAPFCAIHESEHDIMGAGHASTSVSYAVGIKEAMRRGAAEDGKVVAVIGHDVGALREAIGEALEADRPVVVHAKTVKGKGFAPAEEGGLEGMEQWHAAKPKSIANGAPAVVAAPVAGAAMAPPPKPPPQYTQVFGDAMVR